MARRATCSLFIALAALLGMAVVFIAAQSSADHPVPVHPVAGEPIVPPHTHSSDIPNWAMPLGLCILGLIQLLVGVAIKQTLKQYVTKEDCARQTKECQHMEIKPLMDGAVERREKLRYLETAIHDVAVHAEANIEQINHRLEMIERNLQRLTFHLLGDHGIDLKGGD